MNDETNDDPKLTAYALGELGDAERVEVEARLAGNSAARAEVDAVRALAEQLKDELHEEAASQPIKLHRRTRWAGRLAIAAAASGCLRPL
jgi:anti-sigma factor RsiW